MIEDDRKAVRRRCVFTTHTLVPAGHDKFPLDMARRVLGQREDFFALEGVIHNDDSLNMTRLASTLVVM